ncbi:hypothetical protein OIE13_22720 [Streptosporangium sp. NBC_01810]|uniref:hypothetical protein n=1 Tax=Streptosporangium sp. NBC_01810 TaxID=2975951 RepID=UPI002DD8C647|nr:hypothetical protein [Streptosporangium sp. NBC_01810]WSA23759.1 hypothetical protein OIE13_22720 [Streptosporangium sp. NBC_01810]
MSENTGVERETLSITIPPGATEVTRWLVSAYCAPLAMRDSREEACELVEKTEREEYEGDVELFWHEQDPTVPGGPEELYAVEGGVEVTTEYTVAPITIRVGGEREPAPAAVRVIKDF